MKKLLLSSIFIISFISSLASSLDMSMLSCRNKKLNSSTTLADVQANCLIRKQTTSNGRYAVEFRNDATNKDVTCYFGSSTSSAILNGCK